MLVDTGAPISAFNNELLGVADGTITTVESLRVGGITFHGAGIAASCDFASSREGDLSNGIIGFDLLQRFSVTFDYQSGQLILDRKFSPGLIPDSRAANTFSIPFSLSGGGFSFPIVIPASRIILEVSVEDTSPISMLFDTGATLTILETRFFETLPDRPRPAIDSQARGKSGELVQSTITRIASFQLPGGSTAVDMPAAIVQSQLFSGVEPTVEGPIRGLIGGSFFRNFAVTVDYPNRTLFLEPYNELSHLDPNEFVLIGISIELQDGAFIILEVLDDSAAQQAGLLAEDIIIGIDGRDVTGFTLEEIQDLLDVPGGQVVEFEIEREGEVLTIAVEAKDRLPSLTSL